MIQLETAMGAAVGSIPGARAVQVPRTRFAPVKTTNDLLVVWSDAYELTPEGAETFRRAARHIGAGGGRIVVASVPPEIMWVIRRTPDLGSQLPLAATVAEPG